MSSDQDKSNYEIINDGSNKEMIEREKEVSQDESDSESEQGFVVITPGGEAVSPELLKVMHTEDSEQQESSHQNQIRTSVINKDDEDKELDEIESKTRKKSRTQTVSMIELMDDAELDEVQKAEHEKMMEMYAETLKKMEEGEILKGIIIKVDGGEVLVDVGLKSEGIIPLSEFSDPDEIAVGAQVEVYLEDIESQDGLMVLSKQRADFMRVWERIKEAYDREEIVEGRLVRRIKGGIVVNLHGVDAFLPGSQIDLKPIPNMDSILGEKFRFKIIKLNKRRRNIVVSRRIVLEQEREKASAKLLETLSKDQVREGIVKNITDFGAFIDLGGIDGLLHITDMSWGRIKHPSEMLKIGDVTKVKILDYDEDRKRISLGIKQLTPEPWSNAEVKYPVNSKVKGKVVNIADYGAFIELETGVEGLVHISEMSWTKNVRHPSQLLNLNDEVEAVVLSIDKENRKISLGFKQIEPDPWTSIDERYPIGTRLEGRVRNLTNFGGFVEIEEGIDGLVHVSDMSWTKRIRHPSEVINKGDKVSVVVLSIDKGNRRISLGMKQLADDPWVEIEKKYQLGTETRGNISKIIEKKGALVDLGTEIEGFVPISQLGRENIKKIADFFSQGDELPMKVIEVDPKNRRIILSVKDYFNDKEKIEFEKYLEKYTKKEAVSMEEVAGEALLQASEDMKDTSKDDDEEDEEAGASEESEFEGGETDISTAENALKEKTDKKEHSKQTKKVKSQDKKSDEG